MLAGAASYSGSMGTWMATVRFPDGAVRYAGYTTVAGALYNPLHREMCPLGGTLPDGSRCYRATVVGDPDPSFPDRPLSPIDDLVLVTVDRDPDHDLWHALYCPNRAELIGPFSSHYRFSLPESFDLVRDADGLRHLCRHAGPHSECGREIDGEPLGFYEDRGNPWAPPVDDSPPRAHDFFAEWHAPDLCRPCLLHWLTTPEDAPPAEPAAGTSRETRWQRARRLLRGSQ